MQHEKQPLLDTLKAPADIESGSADIERVTRIGAVIAERLRGPWRSVKLVPLTRERCTVALLSLFARAALSLAVLGVHGVVSSSVGQRTRSLGSAALGARRLDILRLIVGRGAALTIVGIAIGLAIVIPLANVMTRRCTASIRPTPFSWAEQHSSLRAIQASHLPVRRRRSRIRDPPSATSRRLRSDARGHDQARFATAAS